MSSSFISLTVNTLPYEMTSLFKTSAGVVMIPKLAICAKSVICSISKLKLSSFKADFVAFSKEIHLGQPEPRILMPLVFLVVDKFLKCWFQ